MEQSQVKSAVRSVLIAVGSYAAGRGWVTPGDLAWLSSDAGLQFAGALVALGAAAWGWVEHRQANLVATVAAMPEVDVVKTSATPAGKALADAVSGNPNVVKG